MAKRLLMGRDIAKELRVQKALARQLKSEEKLRELQARNRERLAELHPHARSNIIKGVKALRKLGLEAGREFRKFRGRERGAIGREIRKQIGLKKR